MSVVRVGLVDNDRFALAALVGFVKARCAGVEIIWAVDGGDRAVELCRSLRTRPDVALVDMSMGDVGGVDVIRRIRGRDDSIVLIGMTSFPVGEYREAARDAGAQAVVSKGDAAQVRGALRACAEGRLPGEADGVPAPQVFDTPAEAFVRVVRSNPAGFDLLNDTEGQIIDLCRRGLSSSQIAERLGVSAATVDTHLSRAARKVGARNRVQLVAMWMEHNARGR